MAFVSTPSTDTKKPEGLLLVMMEPAHDGEQEFHDWYDTEHVPERAAIPGFLSAQRYVCSDGWPRYVALYDLRDVNVLQEAGYRAVAGDNFSPWSKRILAQVHGLYRMEGTLLLEQAPLKLFPWMMLCRFSRVLAESEMCLVDGIKRALSDRADTVRARLFKSVGDGGFDYVSVIEALEPTLSMASFVHGLGPVRENMDIINHYSRYWRQQSRYSNVHSS